MNRATQPISHGVVLSRIHNILTSTHQPPPTIPRVSQSSTAFRVVPLKQTAQHITVCDCYTWHTRNSAVQSLTEKYSHHSKTTLMTTASATVLRNNTEIHRIANSNLQKRTVQQFFHLSIFYNQESLPLSRHLRVASLLCSSSLSSTHPLRSISLRRTSTNST